MIPTRSKSHSHSHSHSQSVHFPSPQTPPHPQHRRGRSGSLSSSLSIARSPNVLSAGTFFAPSASSAMDDIESGISTSTSQQIGGHPLRRVVSNHSRTAPSHLLPLETIHSCEDLPSLAMSKRTKDDMDIDFTRTRKEHMYPPLNQYTNSADADEDEDLKDEIEEPLLGVDIVSTAASTLTIDQDEVYEGPFQPPDPKELLGIIASIFGVGLLAFAACMTTLYDWVL